VSNLKSFILLAAVSAAALPVLAQADASHSHGHAPPTAAQPYAGQQLREIKALSAQEQQDWLDGKGIGLAKTAELNGYPGPLHVLENAAALSLSATQREAAARLMAAHKADVKALGKQLIEAEQALDDAFRRGVPGDSQVSRLTQEVGTLQARIRAAHLQTHLAQTALLQPEQVALYQRLRGYAK
jgi:Spy/CpxP family protein refolding chaperone